MRGSAPNKALLCGICDVHPIPDKERRGHDGGTAARRDGVRVFKQVSGLQLVPSKQRDLVPPTSGYPAESMRGRPPAVRQHSVRRLIHGKPTR
jgi:hypothetical protein